MQLDILIVEVFNLILKSTLTWWNKALDWYYTTVSYSKVLFPVLWLHIQDHFGPLLSYLLRMIALSMPDYTNSFSADMCQDLFYFHSFMWILCYILRTYSPVCFCPALWFFYCYDVMWLQPSRRMSYRSPLEYIHQEEILATDMQMTKEMHFWANHEDESFDRSL